MPEDLLKSFEPVLDDFLLKRMRSPFVESSAFGEVTITGLRTVKEAVRVYDPVNGGPENIAVT